MSHSYTDDSGGSGAHSIKWNGIGLAGRQILVLFFSFLLARMLGPTNYGIIAQAVTYVTLASLVLDQGMTAALISRRYVDRPLLSASMTLNLLVALAIALLTVVTSGGVASFFKTPQLAEVLPVFAISLVLKGAAVVPRMLLMRRLMFRALAIIEMSSALFGGIAGISMALAGFEYWSIVGQLVVTDVFLAALFIVVSRPPWPSFNLSPLRDTLGFSSRVFFSDLLSYTTRNADTVLIGRFLGATQAGLYSLAYRVLLTPIQMVGQTVARALFPLISRRRDDRASVSVILIRAARDIAFVVFPAMFLLAAASGDLISVFLGSDWLPAAPVLSVLAITGARQAVTSLNSPVMLGFGRADYQLRFNLLATLVQVGGIVAGLPFGILGVALGYTIAGILLTPLVFWIQQRLVGTPVARQVRVLLPPLHASIWMFCVYFGVSIIIEIPLLRIAVGGVASLVIGAGVLFAFHRSASLATVRDIRTLAVSRNSSPSDGDPRL